MELLSTDNLPVIFHFQVTKMYKIDAPEELTKWEEMMSENVGLKTNDIWDLDGSGLRTFSACGGGSNFDDCDS